ncbi:hypothetical protein ABHN11_12880 [Brevibacillus centrosporus]|uniref:hypothetical protein n=1 Tax=Brevibacillus centrosporus TaxID=54910 RepID=UPI003D20B3D4
MEQDITYKIVKKLINDMLGRYQIDSAVGNVKSRAEIDVQVAMFERWRQLIGTELIKSGLIEVGYTPKTEDDLGKMSLAEILELRDSYIKWMGGEKDVL